MKECKNCKKKEEKLFQCKGCKQVNYCNEKCQKEDWNKHKTDCKKVTQEEKNIKENKIKEKEQIKTIEKYIKSIEKGENIFFSIKMINEIIKKKKLKEEEVEYKDLEKKLNILGFNYPSMNELLLELKNNKEFEDFLFLEKNYISNSERYFFFC
jgi:hypothetical protein